MSDAHDPSQPRPMRDDALLLDRRLAVEALAAGPARRDIGVEAPERERIAAALDLVALPYLFARFDIAPESGGGRVTGMVKARVRQTCVVTLDPVDNAIDIEVDQLYLPPERLPAEPREAGDLHMDLEGADPPRAIEDGAIDLGALVIEELALAIDPHPRAPGATLPDATGRGVSLSDGSVPPADDRENPFAVLAALKPAPSGRSDD